MCYSEFVHRVSKWSLMLNPLGVSIYICIYIYIYIYIYICVCVCVCVCVSFKLSVIMLRVSCTVFFCVHPFRILL